MNRMRSCRPFLPLALALMITPFSTVTAEVAFIDLMRDVREGPDGSAPGQLVTTRSRVFFVAHDGGSRKLWVTSGEPYSQAKSNNVAKVIDSPDNPALLTACNETLFFRNPQDQGLWLASQGTATGVTARAVANAGRPSAMAALGQRLLYARSDAGVTNLWVVGENSDPTNLSVIFPALRNGTNIVQLVALDNDRFACVIPAVSKDELWLGRLSTMSAQKVVETNAISQLRVVGSNQVWFVAAGAAPGSSTLCRWQADTAKLARSSISEPQLLTPIKSEDGLYCVSHGAGGDSLIWASAPSDSANVLLRAEVTNMPWIATCTSADYAVLFTAGAYYDPEDLSWLELHSCRQTAQGFRLHNFDINKEIPDPGDLEPGSTSGNLCAVDGAVFLTANDGTGLSLYRWNNNNDAGVLTKLTGQGSSASLESFGSFCAFRHALYFAATAPSTGNELYRLRGRRHAGDRRHRS